MEGRSHLAEHFDVLIVGAGLSGIVAARHLQMSCPNKNFLIVESREALGGTWDLFRYPGVRSDSAMYTMAFSFRPWMEKEAIADGATILKYLKETAAEYGIDQHIRYSHRVVEARWSTERANWTVEMECGSSRDRISCTCSFLFMCTGYYNYAEGHTPEFSGSDRFRGRVVHPQHWPADLDYAGKRVVIIGSGATAVTLVPAMATTAAHVTMLQRSPTYIVARPGSDPIANALQRFMPKRWASMLARWENILLEMYFYWFARKRPEKFSAVLTKRAKDELGADYEVAHLTPKYKPWDQRLCLAPDGDIFKTIAKGSASIVTDTIQSFTETGIKLVSGKELAADIIVTATGLKLQLISSIPVYVDDVRVDAARTLNYKGTMFSGIPNFAVTIGYANASWTLKAELSSRYVCRLLNYMDRHKWRIAVPQFDDESVIGEPMFTLTSGYIQRAIDQLPKQGVKEPWRIRQNYVRDMLALRYGKIDDGAIRFSP
jgi:cation diffusion facilitator CzcD-associated flavoprotein CzcO